MVSSFIKGLGGSGVTDEHVVTVLRPFVLGTRPVLDALRESDALGLRQRMLDNAAADDVERGVFAGARSKVLDWVSAVHVPGTPAWAAMDADQRTRWWISRVGRFTALLAAVPGIGGALSDRLPVQDALGAAGQGLLLCAIAGEYGVRDEDDQIRLLAAVLFNRNVDAALAAKVGKQGADRQDAERRGEELTQELAESQRKHGRFTLRAIASTVWRMGRLLWGLGDELGRRPQGRWYHRVLGMLPLVGMAGDYLGERSALHRVAKAGCRWLAQHPAARR